MVTFIEEFMEPLCTVICVILVASDHLLYEQYDI